MLEDDLREMFGARVRTPPSALDPAGVAISRGRRGVRGRRLTLITVACVAFAAMLGGAATLKGMWTPPGEFTDVLTYEGLFGRDIEQPEKAGADLPTIEVPIDVHVGSDLWTADGRKLSLTGMSQVIEVIRVPAGWLYTDDFRLRLMTLGGNSVPIRDNISSWAVSMDGKRVVTAGASESLMVTEAATGATIEATVPTKTRAVGFAGGHVILQHDAAGFDRWEAGVQIYQQTWNNRLLAVYGSSSEQTLGLVEEKGAVCLSDVAPTDRGWAVGQSLGCGELLRAAGRDRLGRADVSLSPDGRWLAIPSDTGVQVIDVGLARATGELAVALTCPSASHAPAVWADDKTVLTISSASGIVACGMDGSRGKVPLPSGVSTGWALVPRYGVSA
ncbi:hypothetical protein Rhe02_71900 [Rhizocola hellebori]|uniref:WD40 repeat domain-containing protein n=1 Tax=Rhizocola hellebori TaxID=1392758 RepID=A0A8J3QDX9_9ACTN|nr:hypothetical protein [Rhizocola hellebori]GIH09123.1 hypothetical protein Rhe02_71900 [Rhizocola hellebori]